MEDLNSVGKLKVAELKKHLKVRGLSVTGNKNELVERLQTSLASGNESIDSSDVLDDGEEDFDEEAILGTTDVSDLGKITLQEEDAVLSGAVKHLAEDNGLPEYTSKQKITLKRSEPCLSEASTIEAEVDANGSGDKQTTNGKADGSDNGEAPRKRIKIDESPASESTESNLKAGGLTQEERRAARVARFGIVTTDSKKSENVGALKKRAERFGEVTSKTLKTEEGDAKLKKRQERFGASQTNSTDIDELKKKRAERFAM